MRIALFVTCLSDTLFPRAGRATVELLERLGHTVEFDPEQTCCGQMHVNSGYGEEALPLVRRFADIFSEAEVVVTPSASCAGTVRHEYARLAAEAGDHALAARVAALAPRVHELCELLVSVLGVEDVGASFGRRVAYHPTCHSLRGLRLGDTPERLLRSVRGLELVALPEATTCCGFGGTFAVKNAPVSSAMLEDKLRSLAASGAEVCTAVDSSCLMQIGGGIARDRLPIEVVHVAEILASGE